MVGNGSKSESDLGRLPVLEGGQIVGKGFGKEVRSRQSTRPGRRSGKTGRGPVGTPRAPEGPYAIPVLEGGRAREAGDQ